MKRVLVLGAGGFIGRNLVAQLLRNGDCHVTAADIAFPRRSPAPESGRLRVVMDDFTTPAAFERVGRGYGEVYMLAALVGVNRTIEEPHEVMRVNTELTMRTLDWLRGQGRCRVVFASSSENYAGTTDAFDWPVPTDESVPLCISDIRHPRFTYALTKIHGEAAFLHHAAPLGFECAVVRYQNIIGPDMGFRHAIPHIVERFSRGEEAPFKVYGSEQTRAFCDVSDAVAGTMGAMASPAAAGEIYHIGNDTEITMDTLTREIGGLMGYDGEYEAAMTYPGSVSRRCPDIGKSRRQLGYEPRTGWREAVARTVAWYREYFDAGGMPEGGGFAPPEAVGRRAA